MKRFLLLSFLIPTTLLAQHFGSVKMDIRSLPPLPAKDLQIEEAVKLYSNNYPLSAFQAEWFYWTNYSRNNPRLFWDSVIAPLIMVYPEFQSKYTMSLKKDLYSINRLPLLKPSKPLIDLAVDQANALASREAAPSHTSPNGRTFQARVQNANILNCAGENISFGPQNAVLGLALLYIDEGVPDRGHRLSLLNSSYTQMGVGIAQYPNNYFMVVQDFSCSQNP